MSPDPTPPVGEGGTLEERDREAVRRMAAQIVSEGRGHRYWTTPGNVFLLATEVARLTAELAEADRRAGAAERQRSDDAKARTASEHWLRQAKQEAGHSEYDSFDLVWTETLQKARLAQRYREALEREESVQGAMADFEGNRADLDAAFQAKDWYPAYGADYNREVNDLYRDLGSTVAAIYHYRAPALEPSDSASVCPACLGSGAASPPAPVEGERETPENALARALLSFNAHMDRWEIDVSGETAQPDAWKFAADWLPAILASHPVQGAPADPACPDPYHRRTDPPGVASVCPRCGSGWRHVQGAGGGERERIKRAFQAGYLANGPADPFEMEAKCERYAAVTCDAPRLDRTIRPLASPVPYRVPATYCPAHGTRFWCEPAGDELRGYCSRCASPAPSTTEEEP